jgi:hypothetical protein
MRKQRDTQTGTESGRRVVKETKKKEGAQFRQTLKKWNGRSKRAREAYRKQINSSSSKETLMHT